MVDLEAENLIRRSEALRARMSELIVEHRDMVDHAADLLSQMHRAGRWIEQDLPHVRQTYMRREGAETGDGR